MNRFQIYFEMELTQHGGGLDEGTQKSKKTPTVAPRLPA